MEISHSGIYNVPRNFSRLRGERFMSKRLYVGNLSYSLRNDELIGAFRAAGEVVSAKIIMDRETNRSKGFAFVEMATEDEGAKAIEILDGKELAGRPLKVTAANPQQDRPVGGNRFGGNREGGFSRGGFRGNRG